MEPLRTHALLLPLLLLVVRCRTSPGWKVAVFEHEVFAQESVKAVLSRKDAILMMKKNLDVYREQARSAAVQNARMIVFPEYGLFGSGLTRDSIAPYVENIPSAKNKSFCPCKHRNVNQSDYFAQYTLSCIARNNQIYVAATVADKKYCTGEFTSKCPADRRWYFNTAVVYDTNGCLVARYHKQNLFSETAFNTPPKVEISTFTTSYGKFGLAICFDILFKSPIVDLVTKHGVETIIFPTAWMDALPLFSGIAFHSAWAMGMKVNVLSANRYMPSMKMTGSGIYTPSGAVAYTCSNTSESARLVVANLPPAGQVLRAAVPTPLNMSLGALIRQVEAPHFTFKSWLFHDHFKFIVMRSKEGLKKVCEHNFCCYLRYEMEQYLEDELYAFGAFWGKHTFEGEYFIQVCAVVRCRLHDLHSTCGSPVSTARTRFRSFYIDGTFNSTFVFPVVLTTNMSLPEPGEIQFGKYPFVFLESKSGVSKPLVTAGLMARLYDKDVGSVLQPGLLCLLAAALVTLYQRQE